VAYTNVPLMPSERCRPGLGLGPRLCRCLSLTASVRCAGGHPGARPAAGPPMWAAEIPGPRSRRVPRRRVESATARLGLWWLRWPTPRRSSLIRLSFSLATRKGDNATGRRRPSHSAGHHPSRMVNGLTPCTRSRRPTRTVFTSRRRLPEKDGSRQAIMRSGRSRTTATSGCGSNSSIS
jgi:hypothetical protein